LIPDVKNENVVFRSKWPNGLHKQNKKAPGWNNFMMKPAAEERDGAFAFCLAEFQLPRRVGWRFGWNKLKFQGPSAFCAECPTAASKG
jgi:hypothetical protein